MDSQPLFLEIVSASLSALFAELPFAYSDALEDAIQVFESLFIFPFFPFVSPAT